MLLDLAECKGIRARNCLRSKSNAQVELHVAQAEKMVSQFEEMGNVLGDLGLALIAMAKYEDEEGARTGSYTDSSAASKDISADTRRVGMV